MNSKLSGEGEDDEEVKKMSECQTKAGNQNTLSLSLTISIAHSLTRSLPHSLTHSLTLSLTHSLHAEQLLFSCFKSLFIGENGNVFWDSSTTHTRAKIVAHVITLISKCLLYLVSCFNIDEDPLAPGDRQL